jgi:hypothetical protein
MNEVGELGRVTDEEDGSVVEDPVPVTFFSLKLNGKASRIASGISGTGLSTYGRESDGGANLLPSSLEEGLRSDVAEVMGNLEVSMGTCTLGVDDTLGDTLTIKVGEEVDVVEVLEKEGSVESSLLSGIRLVDWGTVGGGVDGAVLVLEDLLGWHWKKEEMQRR